VFICVHRWLNLILRSRKTFLTNRAAARPVDAKEIASCFE